MTETRFPLTVAEVLALREEEGFVTPVRPIEPGQLWCVFGQRGTYEFLAHPDDAAVYLEQGIVVDGSRLEVSKVDEWPMVGAWHILCVDTEANRGFTPDVRRSLFKAPV